MNFFDEVSTSQEEEDEDEKEEDEDSENNNSVTSLSSPDKKKRRRAIYPFQKETEEFNQEILEDFYSEFVKPSSPLSLLPFKYAKYFFGNFEGYRKKFCQTNITAHDFNTLKPKKYLNDTIITKYLELIVARARRNRFLPTVYGFDTLFFAKYRKDGYKETAKWIKEAIFNFDYILIPIHEAQLHHWFMIIVDVKKKIIGSFDSMQIDNAYELEHVRQLLVKHAKAIEDIANETADWQIFSDLTVPRQENSFDCGVYACQYAQYVTKKKLCDFRQSQMNYFRKRMKYELLKGIILEN